MASTDLDPVFVKALRLMHSKSKEAGDQLRQMLDDLIAQRKGLMQTKVIEFLQSISNEGGGSTSQLFQSIALGITHVFSYIGIYQAWRKLFEHKVARLAFNIGPVCHLLYY